MERLHGSTIPSKAQGGGVQPSNSGGFAYAVQKEPGTSCSGRHPGCEAIGDGSKMGLSPS